MLLLILLVVLLDQLFLVALEVCLPQELWLTLKIIQMLTMKH